VDDLFEPATGEAYIGCKHCAWNIHHPNRNCHKTPSAIMEHLNKCGGMGKKKQKTISDFVATESEKPYDARMMTKERLSDRLLCVCLSGNISFNAATNPELVSLLSEAWPDIDIPDRKDLKKTLMNVVTQAKSDLKEKLMMNKSKISLALDGWKSKSKIHFQGILLAVTCDVSQTIFAVLCP
jgi:hypothetical protein